jgi:radical SAM protein with 4Fe4S-binding SPASM domain
VVGLRERFRKIFATGEALKAGIYHYRRELGDRQMRLHLRVDPDGQGLLSINASAVVHLNATAAELVKHVLDGKGREEAVREVRKVYRASREQVRADYQKVAGVIDHLEGTEDACPIMNLDVPAVPPFGRKVSAPYRADLALTYECNNRCEHCYVSRGPGEKKSLELEEWGRVLEKLWQVGVPHACFTGGEATLSPHLLPLVEKAEDIGLITGLLTNGRRLADREFARGLCAAGLDHVQVTLESHDAKVHDRMVGVEGAWQETVEGIRNALAEDVYLVTNTTLSRLNVAGVEPTLEFLRELGVRQFAMNSIIYTGRAPESGLGIEETELEPVLGLVTARARELGLRFIWYSPTHYCRLNPTMHGVGYKRCTAAEYNICVEPDGAVIPCQSYYQPAGNILTDEWKDIWESPLFREIRGRDAVGDDCRECPDFEVCGSGCPLSSGDRFLCADSVSEG